MTTADPVTVTLSAAFLEEASPILDDAMGYEDGPDLYLRRLAPVAEQIRLQGKRTVEVTPSSCEALLDEIDFRYQSADWHGDAETIDLVRRDLRLDRLAVLAAQRRLAALAYLAGWNPREYDRVMKAVTKRGTPEWPRSMALETNLGGVTVTVCGCGAILLRDLADAHADYCPIAADFLNGDPEAAP